MPRKRRASSTRSGSPGPPRVSERSVALPLPGALDLALDPVLTPPEPRWSALLPDDLPLVTAAVNAGYLQAGLALVIVARRAGDAVLAAHFVVDTVVAGVLDCYGERVEASDYPAYLADLDDKVTLQSCTLELAAALVWASEAHGAAHGAPQAEGLLYWGRFLPRSASPGSLREAFGPLGRPMLVAELLSAPPPRDERLPSAEERLARLVLAERPREH